MRRAALRRPESLTDKYRIIGIDEEESMTFAIKLVKSHKEGKNDVVLSSATVREIKLLRELHHDNVVHLHDVHVDPTDKTLALVFEYADHDLHDIVVQSRQKPLSEYTRKSLMYQILKGVDYMHDAWVLHRDMKPQNILVVGHGRKRGQVKLADFGLARLYRDPIKALSEVERVVVTLWYRAPELLFGAKHYTKAVDLWAVGCIFAELINTRELFCGKEVEGSNAPFQKDQCDRIFKVLGMPTPQTWEGLENLPEYQNVVQMGRERKYPSQSELKNAVKFGNGRAAMALYDLVSRLLAYDPEQRITAKEALEHEYFKDIEPEPRDWAFDEPGKEPVAFRTQTVEPVSDENLPWKSKKDTNTQGDNAARPGDNPSPGDRQDPNRRRDSSSSRSRPHPQQTASSSRGGDSSRRDDRNHTRSGAPGGGAPGVDSSRGGNPSGGAPPSSGAGQWRDRSVGRGDANARQPSASAGSSTAKRPATNDRQSSASGSSSQRPRSPKQQRRR